MSDIDPNFLINATNAGLTTAFNTGIQAIEARQVNINNALASNQRQNLQANFLYGAGAERARNAEIGYRELLTATQQLEFDERKANIAAYGDLVRANRASTERLNNLKTEKELAIQQSPVMFDLQKTLAEKQLTNEIAGLENQVTVANAQTLEQVARAKQQTLQATIGALNNQQIIDEETNRSKVLTDIHNAIELDNQTGGDPVNQIALLESLVGTRSKAMADSYSELQPLIADLDSKNYLPTELKQKIANVKKVVEYGAANQKIATSLRTAQKAAEMGQLPQGDQLILSKLKLAGLSVTDKNIAQNFNVIPNEIGGYTIVPTSGNGRQINITEEEALNSGVFQEVIVNSNAKILNSNNAITQVDAIKNSLSTLAANPLGGLVAESFQNLYKNARTDLRSPQTVNQIGGVMQELQDDLEKFNPLMNEEFSDLVRESTLAGAIDSLNPFTESNVETLIKRFQTEPGLQARVQQAFNNGDTGGIPKEIYYSYVDRVVNSIIAANPNKYGKASGMSQAAINQQKLNLRNTVISSIKLPKLTDVPAALQKAGIKTQAKITSGPGYLSRQLSNLNKFFYDSASNYITPGIVNLPIQVNDE